MRIIFAILLMLAICGASGADKTAPNAPDAKGKAEAAIEWRQVDVKDVPLEAKKALIAACDTAAGTDEVLGFTYYQTPMEVAETLFKGEFSAGGKRHAILCSKSGEIRSVQATAESESPAKK